MKNSELFSGRRPVWFVRDSDGQRYYFRFESSMSVVTMVAVSESGVAKPAAGRPMLPCVWSRGNCCQSCLTILTSM